MLTYSTTCYNDAQYLDHLEELMVYCKSDKLKLIIVDDCSDEPVEQIVSKWADERVSLYRIQDDLGFGSHAARNLAMKQTTTEWNVLVDIDYKLIGIEPLIEMVDNGELEEDIPHFFPVVHSYNNEVKFTRASINDFVVTAKSFWRAKGYDPEYYGFHHGDRQFIERMTSYRKWSNSLLADCSLEALRSPFVKTVADPTIENPRQERYSEDHLTLYINPSTPAILTEQEILCRQRHNTGASINYLPFNWIKQI